MSERLTIKYKPRYKGSKESEIELQPFWGEYPELLEAISRGLPRQLILSETEWDPEKLKKLLSCIKFVPVKSVFVLGVSEEVLGRISASHKVGKKTKNELISNNRIIKLEGSYSDSFRFLEEWTFRNSGQLVTFVDSLERADDFNSDSDLVLRLNGSWDFKNVAKAIVDYSNALPDIEPTRKQRLVDLIQDKIRS